MRFILEAVLLGVTLSLVFGFGPAFITLVQTSIHRGFKSSAFFVLGTNLNDVFIVALCVLTSIQFVLDGDAEMMYFSFGAGIILILFGIFTYIRKVKEKPVEQPANDSNEVERIDMNGDGVIDEKDDTPHWYTFIGKGFVLNLLNPFMWLFWLSMVALVAGNNHGNKLRTLTFFAITIGTGFVLDLGKAWCAALLKHTFTAKSIKVMNKIAGAALICFGIYFIVKGITVLA